MAKRAVKEAKKVRLTLEEIKANKTGKLLFLDYRGVEGGGWTLKAPPSVFGAPAIEDLLIRPFKPQVLQEFWIEHPQFIELYEKVKEIEVCWSDVMLKAPDLTPPDKLKEKVSQARMGLALQIAQSPYGEREKNLIQTGTNKEVSQDDAFKWEREEYVPFLLAVRFFEGRLLNRTAVMHDVTERIESINKSKSVLEGLSDLSR